MKKNSLIFGLALVSMLAVSCSKDATEETVKKNKVVIGATIDATRTELGDKTGTTYPVLWSAGDRVAVNGVTSAAVADTYVGKASAQFEVEGVAAPYSVLYPASALNANGRLTIAAEQTYVEGSFANGSAVMVGYGETTDVTMKNLYAFVKVPVVKGDELTLQSVTLYANNLEALSGEFAIDYANATIKAVAGMDYVTVSSPSGIAWKGGKAEVIVAVPAGEYAKGFSVELIATNGAIMTKQAYSAEGRTLAAGTLLAMPEVEFFSDGQIAEIKTAAQLQAFLTACETDYTAFKSPDGEVKLASDIDLTGVTLTSAKTFNGIFNGQGYALKNWTSDGVSLFEILMPSAVVKNVVIDSSCTLTYPAVSTKSVVDPENPEGDPKTEYIQAAFGFIVEINNGVVSGCVNNANIVYEGELSNAQRGAIVGITNPNGGVANCVNNGNITLNVSNHTVGTMHIGGVSGRLESAEGLDTTIANCVNNGDVALTIADVTGKNLYMGGVTGASNSYTKTVECYNYGNISIYAEGGFGGVSCLAGVTGYSAGPITSCYNEGAVSIRSDKVKGDGLGNVKGCVIGGITPYQNGPIADCINRGDLSIYCGTFVGRNTIGGITEGKSESTAAPAIGGIVGYGFSSASGPFTITNCDNYGKITYRQMTSEGEGATFSGRHSFGGVIAAPAGDVTNCNNYGDMDIWLVTTNHTAYEKKVMPVVGGISGSDYYVLGQSSSNIIDCTNYGNLYIVSDGYGANSTFGGIVGWPGVEGTTQTTVRRNCVNYGNMTVKGFGKHRCGGIQGGSGPMENCINYGAMTISDSAQPCALGGLVGFQTQEHGFTDCENYGDITSTTNAATIGGFVGGCGNSAMTYTGGKNRCTVKTVSGGIAGMLIGKFNGTSKAIKVGTSSKKIKVAGTLIVGSTTTEIDADKITKEYMFGNDANRDKGHTLYAEFLEE